MNNTICELWSAGAATLYRTMAPLLALLPLLASSASSSALRSMAEQIAELDQRAAAGLPACECLPSLCVRSRCRFRGQPVSSAGLPTRAGAGLELTIPFIA